MTPEEHQDEHDMVQYDTDYCLCGKRVILTNGVPSDHHPKRSYQPRFLAMTRKERKAMWCDIWRRLEAVTQKVITRYNDNTYRDLDVFQECLLAKKRERGITAS